MAYLLVRAFTDSHLQAGTREYEHACRYRGAIIDVREDSHPLGTSEQWAARQFAVIRFPGVPVTNIERFAAPEYDIFAPKVAWRTRRHMLRWADLPNAVRNRLQNSGQLVISTGFYNPAIHPAADYSWGQVRAYFRDLQTGADESGTL